MADMTESTTHCAKKRFHDNVSNFFAYKTKLKKGASSRDSSTNVVDMSNEPVKDTTASQMTLQLLQHLTPKDGVANAGTLASEDVNEVLDLRLVPISTSKSRLTPSSSCTDPPEGLLAQGFDLGRDKKEAVDEFKTSEEYKERLRAYAKSQKNVFAEQSKLSTEGQEWFKDRVRTTLRLARRWIKKEHLDSDISALYLHKDDKYAEDNSDD
ncbi:hypothetical protein LIER_04204 [Lithospermum erythrorhizon]|uniref:Uncharacterized protein n=1 Tax=Lithospermum erythrorhizon TaxID=34254 RepID=A0AAV3P015_LITER